VLWFRCFFRSTFSETAWMLMFEGAVEVQTFQIFSVKKDLHRSTEMKWEQERESLKLRQKMKERIATFQQKMKDNSVMSPRV
jgi:hypothetical protein